MKIDKGLQKIRIVAALPPNPKVPTNFISICPQNHNQGPVGRTKSKEDNYCVLCTVLVTLQ